MTMHFSAYPEAELARLLKEQARADGHMARLPRMPGTGMVDVETISIAPESIAAVFAIMGPQYKSTAEIMAEAGLRKGTVWRVVTALIQRGDIEKRPRAGRRPAMYRAAQ